MVFYIVDDGRLPSSVVPLYVSVGESEQEETFSDIGVIWQLGNTEKARKNRSQILSAAKKKNVPLKTLCNSLHVKWTDLCEWVGGERNALYIFIVKKNNGQEDHHAWYDEFKNETETLMSLLDMPKNVRL